MPEDYQAILNDLGVDTSQPAPAADPTPTPESNPAATDPAQPAQADPAPADPALPKMPQN